MIVVSRFFKNDEIFKDLIQTVGVYLPSFTVFFLEIFKKKLLKKALKITSQLVIFRAFFLFFVPSTLNLKKNPVNQLIKKFWPYS